MNAQNVVISGNRNFFRFHFQKIDNSFPHIKIAIREWLLSNINQASVLDVYGGNGLMFERVWKLKANTYRTVTGDALKWLSAQDDIHENLFDIDTYGLPFKALEIIGNKAIAERIGVVCTDGALRRAGMMRLKMPKFLQEKCKWPERDLSLMAGIYHQYPRYLRYVIDCIVPQWEIERLVIRYGKGTWKQAMVYFAIVLRRKNVIHL